MSSLRAGEGLMSPAPANRASCLLFLWTRLHPVLRGGTDPARERRSLLLRKLTLGRRRRIGGDLSCRITRRESPWFAIWIFEFEREKHLL